METTATIIINALVISSIYILVALGFALLLSIIGIFNFAHGAIYMVGAYVTYVFSVSLGINQWTALLVSVMVLGAFGLFLERFCFRPFQSLNKAIIMAIALVLIMQTTVSVTIGGLNLAIPSFVPGNTTIGMITLSTERLVTLLIGGVLLAAMTMFIRYTRTGHQMLAISQDRDGAVLMGIKVNSVAAVATVAACAMAALSGSLMGSLYSVTPYMGDGILLKAIQVIILSGIGSIGGILAGGLIVGTVDAALPVFTNGPIASAVSLGVVMLILLIRPKGLFGYELF